MAVHDVTLGADAPAVCNAVIEVSRGSNNKYEIDKDTGMLHLDRVLHSPFFYPADYGFFPQTLCDDGDPLDVLVLIREPLPPMAVVPVRPVGYLMMKDEKGQDEKVIAVAEGDPAYENVKDLSDLPQNTLDGIGHFFAEYKRNEKGKWAEVAGWHTAEEAKTLIESAQKSAANDN